MASFPEEIPGDDLIRAFTLTGADRDLVALRRGAANRLGLALQLCALRYLGFVPRNLSAAPRSAACFVADQLEVSPDEIQSYARREQTRRQHKVKSRFPFAIGSHGLASKCSLAKYLGVAQKPAQPVHFAVLSALSEPAGERVRNTKGAEFFRLILLTLMVRHDGKAVFPFVKSLPGKALWRGGFAVRRKVDQKEPVAVFSLKVIEVVLDLILLVTGVRLVLNGQSVGLSIGAADVNGDVNTPVCRDLPLDDN